MKGWSIATSGIALWSLASLPNTVEGLERPLSFKVEASSEHYGSRGVCIGYRVPANSLVTGYFDVRNPHPGVRANALIFEGGNQPFSQQELNGEARFSFRSHSEPANYEACVRALPKNAAGVPPGTMVEVRLSLKWKFDLFDEKTAKQMMLEPIEAEFYQLEESIHRLSDEMNAFVENEEKLRDTNESTLDRIRLFAVFTVMILILSGMYQVVYLKKFFKTKKII